MKTCITCKQTFEESNFTYSRNTKDNLTVSCTACYEIWLKKTNPEAYKAHIKRKNKSAEINKKIIKNKVQKQIRSRLNIKSITTHLCESGYDNLIHEIDHIIPVSLFIENKNNIANDKRNIMPLLKKDNKFKKNYISFDFIDNKDKLIELYNYSKELIEFKEITEINYFYILQELSKRFSVLKYDKESQEFKEKQIEQLKKVFAEKLIRPQTFIKLLDNYIDEEVLILLKDYSPFFIKTLTSKIKLNQL